MPSRIYLLFLVLTLSFTGAAWAQIDPECRAAPDPNCLLVAVERLSASRDLGGIREALLIQIGQLQARTDQTTAAIATFSYVESLARGADNDRSLVYLATQIAKVGMPERALTMFDYTSRLAQTDRAVSAMVSALADGGSYDEARAMWRRISDRREHYESAFDIMMSQARSADVASTQSNFEQLESPDDRDLLMLTLAIAQTDLGDVDGVTASVSQIMDPSRHILGQFELIEALAKTDRTAEAQVLLDLIQLDPLMTVENRTGDSLRFNFGLGLVRIGDVEAAITMAQSNPTSRTADNALQMIALELARSGQRDKALIAVDLISDPLDRPFNLNLVAQGLAEAGMSSEALQIVESQSDPVFLVGGLIQMIEAMIPD